MLRYFKENLSNVLLLSMLGLLLFPFILLSFYAMPNLEDYAESIIPSVWWHVKFLYLSYDGRFFTSFLFAAFNPLKFESYFLYQCIPIVLIIALLFSLYKLSLTFISSSKRFALVLSTLILVVFLNRNPNLPYTLYYMISSYVYIVPSIFFLLLISISYKVLKSKGNNIFSVFFICCSIFAVAGGNELLLIPTLVWFIFLAYLNFYLKAEKGKELSLFFLSILCSYFVVFTSPGVKESIHSGSVYEEGLFLLESILKSISFMAFHIKNWLTGNYPLYISSILFFYLIQKKSSAIYNPQLTLMQNISFSLFLISALFFIVFPYTWAAREAATASYTQVFIIPHLFFTIFWFYILFLFIPKNKEVVKFKSQNYYYVLLAFLLLSFIFDKNSNIRTAYQDLWSKNAYYYKQEIMANIQKSKPENQGLNKNGEIELCTLNHQPKSLYSGVYFNENSENFHLQYKMFYTINKLKIKSCH